MIKSIPEGIKHRTELKVEKKDSAHELGSGMVDVFATPAMIALMEKTCSECVRTYLEENETTVGFEVSIRHVKPTPIGMKVWCEAKLIQTESKKLVFELRAWDENGEIGQGNHTRYIVDHQEFMQSLNAD